MLRIIKSGIVVLLLLLFAGLVEVLARRALLQALGLPCILGPPRPSQTKLSGKVCRRCLLEKSFFPNEAGRNKENEALGLVGALVPSGLPWALGAPWRPGPAPCPVPEGKLSATKIRSQGHGQRNSRQAYGQASGPADQETSRPANQRTSGPVDQPTSRPAVQETTRPAHQRTSGPADHGVLGTRDEKKRKHFLLRNVDVHQ